VYDWLGQRVQVSHPLRHVHRDRQLAVQIQQPATTVTVFARGLNKVYAFKFDILLNIQ